MIEDLKMAQILSKIALKIGWSRKTPQFEYMSIDL